MNAALRTAAHEGCDVLVQVGDFWLQDRNWGCLAPEGAGLMLSTVRSEMPVVVATTRCGLCLEASAGRDEGPGRQPAAASGGSLWWADRGSTWT